MTETAVKSEIQLLLDKQAEAEQPASEEEPIDEELVEEAMRGVGARSRNAAINAVVREYVMNKRKQRRAALEAVRQMADEGLFDFSSTAP